MAFEHYNKALEELRTLEQLDNWTYVLSSLYQRISFSCRLNKKYEESLEWEKKALEIREANLSENDELIAGAYSSLALAYQAAGNSKEALNFCEKAHFMRVKLFGDKSWVTGISCDWLAMMRTLEGKFVEALELANKARGNFEDKFGKESLYVGYNLSTMGRLYQIQEDFEEAIKCYNESIQTLEKAVIDYNLLDDKGRNFSHGEAVITLSEHPLCSKYARVKILQRLATCYFGLEKRNQAKEVLNKSVTLAEEIGPIATKKAQAKLLKMEKKFEKEKELDND